MASAVLFPALYKNIRRKNLSVAEALKENRWILGIAHDLTPTILHEFFAFWLIIAEQRICLNTGQEDTIIWTQTSGGVYTAKSEYNLQFMGGIHSTFPVRLGATKGQNFCLAYATKQDLDCRSPATQRLAE